MQTETPSDEIKFPERKELTIKQKLIINDFRYRFPTLDNKELSDIFCVKPYLIEGLFRQQYITIESKLNKLNNFNNGKEKRRREK
jgi:hypothetical protein